MNFNILHNEIRQHGLIKSGVESGTSSLTSRAAEWGGQMVARWVWWLTSQDGQRRDVHIAADMGRGYS